jgi:phosphate transport system substrate-binding protein
MKMMPFLSAAGLLGLVCSLVLNPTTAQAQTLVRLHGAVTMEKLFTAQKAAIETQTGARLEIVGNGSGRGLADLSSGLADVAIVGGSLKGLAEAANKEKPGSVDPAGMVEIPISSVKLAIVTHPSAGVKNLSIAQLRDVFSGKAKSWKDVGGADVPVKMVLPFLGDGARISLQESVLKDTPFTKEAILRNSSKDLAVVVAQVPGSCSFLSVKNIDPSMTVVTVDAELAMPLELITKGEPAGDVKKVVDLARTLIK